MFRIEDEKHADDFGDFLTLNEALTELRRLEAIAWDQNPNRAPCTNWRRCGRDYEILEYDGPVSPHPIRTSLALRITSQGSEWSPDFPGGYPAE